MTIKYLLTACMTHKATVLPSNHKIPENAAANCQMGGAKNKDRKFAFGSTASAHFHLLGERVREKVGQWTSFLSDPRSKTKIASMSDRNGTVIHLQTPAEKPHNQAASSRLEVPFAVQSAQVSGKICEKEHVCATVQRGLTEAIEYCKSRDKHATSECSEIFFHENDIPSLNSLKPVIQHYIDHKKKWNGPVHVTKEDWPCSILADRENQYLLFPLIIGQGGKKAGIYLGMDLSTGENVVISKIETETNKDFNTLFFPSHMMDKLKPLFPAGNKGGLLPIKHVFDIHINEIKQQFVVQKLCKEGNLLALLSSGVELPPTEMQTIANELFIALHSLQKNHLLHKDLKPENVFLDDGHAYLGDFDYLSSLRDLEYEDKVRTLGTFAYLPPEYIIEDNEGKRGEYGPKSEVWGLGLLLYSLFSSKQPKVVQELEERGEKFKYSAARVNSWNPWFKKDPASVAEELVSKMICTEPDERSDLKAAYEEFLKIPKEQLSFNME